VKVNQDNFGSHYRFVSATQKLDLKIRHTTEKPSKGVVMDRHNVDLTQTIFSGDPSVPDTVYQSYVVLRNPSNDLGDGLPDLGNALSALLASGTVLADLVGWQN
jgi:hypothetical protein